MYFQDLYFLFLIPLIIVGALFVKRKEDDTGVEFSSTSFFSFSSYTVRVFLTEHLFVLRVIAAIFIVVALSRPQAPLEESRVETEGIEIVLAVDVSGSMLAEDFSHKKKRVNRLAAVKDVVKDFVKGRSNDRIGLVAFAGRAYSVAPLTLDYGWLMQNVDRLEIGLIEDGTSIGSGLSSALNRLENTEAKGKVVILLTDGRNNAGNISPDTAAEIGKALNVRVYTIGAGTTGKAPFPVKDFFGNTVYRPIDVDIDEDTLKMIASKTGGKYFRATDTASLKKIYKEIDKLEKTEIIEQGYLEYKELFIYFMYPALFLLLLEVVLANTLLRRLP